MPDLPHELSLETVLNKEKIANALAPDAEKDERDKHILEIFDQTEKDAQKILQEIEVIQKEIDRHAQDAGNLSESLTLAEISLTKYRNDWWAKVLENFNINDKKLHALKEEVRNIRWAKESAEQQTNASSEKKRQKILDLEEKGKQGFREAKLAIEKFQEKYEYHSLSPEQVEGLFTEEILSQLSLEQYVELWKRGSPNFVSHVTRHGFRDHFAMMYHTGGLGEYHDFFPRLVESGKEFMSPLAARELPDRSDESIRKWLEKSTVFQQDTIFDAEELFSNMLDFTLASAPNYPDKTATHFAAQRVLDDYYGGESENEIFYIFPSDFIASQHAFAFNGWEKDFTRPQSEDKWNDIFVWTKNNKGMALDAGIVFLPKSTQVDRNTGSKYMSEVLTHNGENKRERIKDEAAVPDFKEFIKKHSDELKQLGVAVREERTHRASDKMHSKIVQWLTEIGWTSGEAHKAVYDIVQEYIWRNDTNWTDEKINEVLEKTGKMYQKPKEDSAVSAQEYWESYFQKHESQKPKHIVYYDGDPTSALIQFLEDNGINRFPPEKGKLLGFEKNLVTDMANDPRSNEGYDELKAKGLQFIKEHFAGELQMKKEWQSELDNKYAEYPAGTLRVLEADKGEDYDITEKRHRWRLRNGEVMAFRKVSQGLRIVVAVDYKIWGEIWKKENES